MRGAVLVVIPPIVNAPESAGWTPYQVATTFQYPALQGYTGRGVTIAVFGDVPPQPRDLQTYIDTFGIRYTGQYSIVSVNGSDPYRCESSGVFRAGFDVGGGLE